MLGLFYGDGDPTQTMIRCSEFGIDADCNAGNAGAILGAYLGHTLMPMDLKRFTREEIITALSEWGEKSIQNLANRTYIQYKRIQACINTTT